MSLVTKLCSRFFDIASIEVLRPQPPVIRHNAVHPSVYVLFKYIGGHCERALHSLFISVDGC